MAKLDLPKIEKKWQRRWEKANLYKTKDKVKRRKNFYHLVMFPYPSGDLHIGHWYNFAPADTYARFKRMQGFNVLSPIGFDAFGLPAENAAIKRNIHPADWTFQNIETMRVQLKSMGPMYDWSRELITCNPDYYKWTQWMFLQMFKAGKAQKRKTWANWCPSCKTVLANEQVVEGRCERCNTEVLQRQIDQWVFTITDYAQRLLDDLDILDWPDRTKTMQKNWIGRSSGAQIVFPLHYSSQIYADFTQKKAEKIQRNSASVLRDSATLMQIKVFTTRPDTIFGATYLVLAPEHPILRNQESGIRNYEEVQEYIKQSLKKTPLQRQAEQKQKTGVEIQGIKAINPATNKEIPIWVADYVLGEYGTGAIMAVPAHDERDFEFAKTFGLPIIEVIASQKGNQEEAYTGEGILANSGKFTGMKSQEAIPLMAKEFGEPKVQYKLRDWIVSRQRYWGAPIPMVECPKCGLVPVPEKELPVLLPELKNFHPADDGRSPLAKVKEFVNTSCPKCKGPATRETDTMDTFVDSSWYYLRYTDPQNDKVFANKDKMKAWLPVDIYIGGAEHTVLHLLYSRFFTKALYDLKHIHFTEPFAKLRHQGIILGSDGQKMSKSRGNVIDPDPLVAEYGSDAVRMFLEFLGPYDQGGPWSPGAINGIARFLERASRFVLKGAGKPATTDETTLRFVHKTIKKIIQDLEELKFNTAISALMVFVNTLHEGIYGKELYETFTKLLAPFAPHLSEELWAKLGHKTSVHKESFPSFDEALTQEGTITFIVQVNGKLRGKITAPMGLSQEEAVTLAKQDEAITHWIAGEPKKIVFVPNKLINFVIP